MIPATEAEIKEGEEAEALIARNELDVSEEITNAVVPEQRADGSYPGEVWLPVFLSWGVVRRRSQKGSKARSGTPGYRPACGKDDGYHICGASGHWARDCPLRGKKGQKGLNQYPASSKTPLHNKGGGGGGGGGGKPMMGKPAGLKKGGGKG